MSVGVGVHARAHAHTHARSLGGRVVVVVHGISGGGSCGGGGGGGWCGGDGGGGRGGGGDGGGHLPTTMVLSGTFAVTTHLPVDKRDEKRVKNVMPRSRAITKTITPGQPHFSTKYKRNSN